MVSKEKEKEVQILFEVDGRKFEAVGYIYKNATYYGFVGKYTLKDEPRVTATEMFYRVKNHKKTIVDDTDLNFLFRHIYQLPVKLRKFILLTDHKDVRQDGYWERLCVAWSKDSNRWTKRWCGANATTEERFSPIPLVLCRVP